jgi:uncharacterized protein YxeA
MKTILFVIAILMVTVTTSQAQRKNTVIHNHYIIQDNRTKSERITDNSRAYMRSIQNRNDARRNKIMSRAYSNANKNNRRMQRNLNRILRNSKIQNSKRLNHHSIW